MNTYRDSHNANIPWSGIGKGIIGKLCLLRLMHMIDWYIASSTGLLLKTKGLNVTSVKIDPYINIDAGTISL